MLTFVLSAVCVALLPINYVLYSIFLTPTFVLLAEATEGDWSLAWVRILNTLLGGALALLGARLLWPYPERRRLPAFLAAALRANREYLRRTVALFGDRSERGGGIVGARLERLVRQLETLHHAVQRMYPPPEPARGDPAAGRAA